MKKMRNVTRNAAVVRKRTTAVLQKLGATFAPLYRENGKSYEKNIRLYGIPLALQL